MCATEGGPIGVFGGTFDPVHKGHIELALQLKQQLGLVQLYLQPANIPPHKADSSASSAERAAMVALAAADTGLEVDLRELQRDGPSYTVDTLGQWRAQLGPERPLCFCVGMDALVQLDSWQRWREIFELAHLLVLPRPGWALAPEPQEQGPSPELGQFLLARQQLNAAALAQRAGGYWYLCQGPLLAVSSTEIRRQLATGVKPTEIEQLAQPVAAYIEARGLYANNIEQEA